MKGVVVVEGPLQEAPGRSWAPPVAALAPVANRPLLTSAIETLALAGADEVVVVADRHAMPHLRSSIAGEAVGAAVAWRATDRPPTVGEALLEAAVRERALLHTTAGLWLRGRASLVRTLSTGDADVLAFGDGRSVAGVLAVGPAFLDALRDGAVDVADAVARLRRAGARVASGPADGWWRYEGGPHDLLDANRLALDELEASQPGTGVTDSRIQGRVRIDPTARVHRSVLRGPILVGAHAVVADAYVGPSTTIGDAATVRNAEIEGSILLAGARVHDLGTRLEDSVVGQGATITRSFDVPKALRLLVGDDARVAVC